MLNPENTYKYVNFKTNVNKFIFEDKIGFKYFKNQKNKIFCLNSGSCGSMYIVKLLNHNLIKNCYHQKFPEMNNFGLKLFNKKNLKVPWYFKLTRRHIFFESSNRLFSFTNYLNKNYQPKFIHLFRNPFEYLESTIKKKNFFSNFKNTNHPRYNNVNLCGALSDDPLIRAANYWFNINNKIFEDFKNIENKKKIWIDCQNLFKGEINNFEKFIGFELKIKKINRVNTKDNLINIQKSNFDVQHNLLKKNKNLHNKINNLFNLLKEKELEFII